MWSGTEKRNSAADHVGDLGVLGVDLAGALGHVTSGHMHTHGGGDLRSGQAGLLGDLVGGELAVVLDHEAGDGILALGDSGVGLAGAGLGLLVAGVQLGDGVAGELDDLGGHVGHAGDSGVELTVGHGIFLSAQCATASVATLLCKAGIFFFISPSLSIYIIS